MFYAPENPIIYLHCARGKRFQNVVFFNDFPNVRKIPWMSWMKRFSSGRIFFTLTFIEESFAPRYCVLHWHNVKKKLRKDITFKYTSTSRHYIIYTIWTDMNMLALAYTLYTATGILFFSILVFLFFFLSLLFMIMLFFVFQNVFHVSAFETRLLWIYLHTQQIWDTPVECKQYQCNKGEAFIYSVCVNWCTLSYLSILVLPRIYFDLYHFSAREASLTRFKVSVFL